MVLNKDHAILWIDTEGSFSAQRLVQIARERRSFDSNLEKRLFDRVLIWKIDDLRDLGARVGALTVSQIHAMGVKCIIIDSIACLSRSSTSSRISAANSIQAVIRRLKLLADQAGLWIVVSNQMTTARVVEEEKEIDSSGESEAVKGEEFVTTPALV